MVGRWRVRISALAVSLLAASTALVTADAATAAPPHPTAVLAAEYEAAPCVVEIPVERRERVTCGYLTVPERRGDDADPERTLRLPVTVIQTSARDAAEDPLVIPVSRDAGGDMASVVAHVLEDAAWATRDRDVIIVEQRGGVFAEPSLVCDELSLERTIVDGRLATTAEREPQRLSALQACRDRLIEDGVDPAAYTTAAAAADLADLRAAMRIDAWNVAGIGDGSRVALTLLRDHPEGLRTVVLDSAEPPQVDRLTVAPDALTAAITALLAQCGADRECGDRYPDLQASLDTVLADAEATPLEITVKSPVDRAPLVVSLDDEDLIRALRAALADTSIVPVLPFVIDRLAAGDTSAALPVAQRLLDQADAELDGARLSRVCAEELPFTPEETTDATAEDAGGALRAHMPAPEALRAECAVWEVPASTAVEAQPVEGTVPTLLLAGADDPIAPPEWAAAAADGLPAASAHAFPSLAHAPLWTTDDSCVTFITMQFLADPSADNDTSCPSRMTSTVFLTTADVQPTSALYRLSVDVAEDHSLGQIIVLVLTLGMLFVTFVYGCTYGMRWLARRRGRAPEGAVLSATVAAGLDLAFAGGLFWLLSTGDPLVLAFGIPAAAWPLLLLPFAALASTAVLIAVLVRAWRGGDGTFAHRVFLSVSAIATVAFTLWLLARGLLFL